jgi:hypothetical protein
MTYRIVTTGDNRVRVEADAVLDPKDFGAIAERLDVIRARKIGFVAAKQAAEPTGVETRWNGRETTNTARPGDWIVTNLTPQQEALRDRDGHVNTYVILADRFAALYEPTGGQNEFGAIHRAKGVVEAIRLAGGFDLVAPWGERQTSLSGYLLSNGKEVYGNNAETFTATYQVLAGYGVADRPPLLP